MLAAIFVGPGRVELQERPKPAVVTDWDVIVAVEACGICGSDLKMVADPPGHPGDHGVVIGHEIVGRVEAVGAKVEGVKPGDRVVMPSDIACGECLDCKMGRGSACQRSISLGVNYDGGLAAFLKVPASACYRISDDIPTPVAALTEPLACVMNGIRLLEPFVGQRALIVGAGAVGLLLQSVLSAAGVRSIIVEPSPIRRAAASVLPNIAVLDPNRDDIAGSIRELTGGGVDVAIDAVGSQMVTAIDSVRDGGRILLFGMDSTARATVTQNDITRRELTIVGSFSQGQRGFPDAVLVQSQQTLVVDHIISDVVPLADVLPAMDKLRNGEATKVVIVP